MKEMKQILICKKAKHIKKRACYMANCAIRAGYQKTRKEGTNDN